MIKFRLKRMKYKFMWWLAWFIPEQAALYAFVRVHSLSGEGPDVDGEYKKSYDLWVTKKGIEE